MNNKFNKVFPSFDLFNKEFTPSSQLIDIFSSQFSFYLSPKQTNNNFKTHICLLDNISFKSSLDPSYTLVISDASIKNYIATSILYIYIHNKPVIKTLHHTVNVKICCSNHSSLKDKWSHNEQSSPMGYQVTSGGITRELDKEPSLYCSSIYITYRWSVLQQYLSGP